MLRLNRIALVVGAVLAPFAASGLVVVLAGWIEAITGHTFVVHHVSTLATLVAIGAAIAAAIAVIEWWEG